MHLLESLHAESWQRQMSRARFRGDAAAGAACGSEFCIWPLSMRPRAWRGCDYSSDRRLVVKGIFLLASLFRSRGISYCVTELVWSGDTVHRIGPTLAKVASENQEGSP